MSSLRRQGVGNRMDMMVTDGSRTRTQVYNYDAIYQITD
jgi:hypothetical protein